MSCTNFSSNTQPNVVFAGSLPPDFCPATWAEAFEAFIAAMTGILPDNYSTFLISDSEPAASDRDKVWVEVDSLTCRPAGLKLYLNGTWISIGANLFYGLDESVTDDIVLVNSTNPVITWAQDGHAFIVLFTRACTGPAVITIKNGGETIYSSRPIRKFNNLPLEALDYLDGMIGILVYNLSSNTFRLTNPRLGGGTSTGGGGTSSSGFNLSFDEDADQDGEPDAWDVYVNNEAYVGEASTDAETAPAGGSFELDPAGVHGKQAVKFTCSNGVGNGGGFIQTKGHIEITGGKIQEFSWWCRTNSASISNRVELLWYDEDKTYLSKTELWSTATANPNGVWYQLGGIAKPLDTVRYCKVRLYAGVTGTAVGGEVKFDDFRFEAPTFQLENVHTQLGGYTIKIPAGKFQVRATIAGGGGAGGIAGLSASTAGSGGGGGGGTVIVYVPVVPADAYTVEVGPGGIGHTGGSRAGGLSRLTVGANIWQANGGAEGQNRPNTGSAFVVGGTGGTTSGAGTWGVEIPGLPGYPLIATESSAAVHWGGNSALGAGASAKVGQNGGTGMGIGGGSAGSFANSIIPADGGVGYSEDGGDGAIIFQFT